MSSFNDFNLPTELSQALVRMNYLEPTPVQKQAIPVALEGRDLIASAQTGTGKTAAFGIPLICKLLADPTAQALILAPTRELAGQILLVIRDLTANAKQLNAVLLIGGVHMGRQKEGLLRNPRIIVATPGRLVDHLERKRNLLSRVKYLVLDEADRMLDMGFAPQLRTIRQAVTQDRQTLLFSATYPTDIAELAKEWLKNPERVAIGSVSQPASKVSQEMVEVLGDKKPDIVLEELDKREGSVLIFTRTKRRADRLALLLKEKGHKTCRIHSDRSQGQRQQALTGFREGSYRIMVATDIAARGIDVPHIEHVINFDLPMVPDDYLHRIGRTGRAGKSGQALCLVSPEERGLWRSIQKLMSNTMGLHSSERKQFNTGKRGSRGSDGGSRRSDGESRGPRDRGQRNFQKRSHGSQRERSSERPQYQERSFERSSERPSYRERTSERPQYQDQSFERSSERSSERSFARSAERPSYKERSSERPYSPRHAGHNAGEQSQEGQRRQRRPFGRSNRKHSDRPQPKYDRFERKAGNY